MFPLVVDLGCGNGWAALFLGEHGEYIGIDISEKYITSAEQEYGEHGRFHVFDVGKGDLSQEILEERIPDIILMAGVIHHLSDEQFLHIKKHVMDKYPNSIFVAIDPVFIKNQHPFARLLKRMDRGNFVRTAEKYRKLMEGYDYLQFPNPRIPYDYISFYKKFSVGPTAPKRRKGCKLTFLRSGKLTIPSDATLFPIVYAVPAVVVVDNSSFSFAGSLTRKTLPSPFSL